MFKLSSSHDCEDFCQNLDKFNLNNESKFVTSLPLEILYYIFEFCPLKTQLVVADVCILFRHIIRDIVLRNCKIFNYNYFIFLYKHSLTNDEISKYCFLFGQTVERLRFNTFLEKNSLKHIDLSGIHIGCDDKFEKLIYFIQNNFKQNIHYFPNIKELEVQGPFINDFVIMELAKCCKKLITLRLLDTDYSYPWGEHLQHLESIENLELTFCSNLSFHHMLAVSKKRQLKSLNIVECNDLKTIKKMLKLCNHWHYLETLRLNAFKSNRNLLKAIINLPALKILQFFGIHFMPLKFEENFFHELSKNKKKSLLLKHIKFETENVTTMNASGYINDQRWQWSPEYFNKISLTLKKFKNANSLTFLNCRLLDYKQIKHLNLINKNIELIKINGCPKEEDDQLRKQWQNDVDPSKCQLRFESGLPLKKEKEVNEDDIPLQYYPPPPYGSVILHSIECRFCKYNYKNIF